MLQQQCFYIIGAVKDNVKYTIACSESAVRHLCKIPTVLFAERGYWLGIQWKHWLYNCLILNLGKFQVFQNTVSSVNQWFHNHECQSNSFREIQHPKFSSCRVLTWWICWSPTAASSGCPNCAACGSRWPDGPIRPRALEPGTTSRHQERGLRRSKLPVASS